MSEKISKNEKAEIVFDLVEKLKEAKQGAVKSFLVIGQILDRVESEKLYLYYGQHIETFDNFLREVRMGRATAYNCVRIWREFGEILKSKNLDIEYFRLVRLLPVVEADNKEDWLNKAQDLDVKAFDDEIREAKGKVPTDSCNHTGEKMYLERCMTCGKMRKVSIEQLKEITEDVEIDKQKKG